MLQKAYEGIKRRSFLKIAGLSPLGITLGPMFATWGKTSEAEAGETTAIWRTDSEGNRYFVPTAIKTDRANDGVVTAKVDGWWKKYQVREFDDEFHQFWLDEKVWYYDQLIGFFEDETDELAIPNGGHHHPMLSTYGKKIGRRGDSDFHLNTAVKGFTIIPKEDRIDYINSEVEKVYASGDIPVDIFKMRQQLYQEKDLWDKTRFATLELYTGRPVNSDDTDGNYGFMETKTFQNLYANPMAALSYMALYNTEGTQSYFGGEAGLTPTFCFRGFCWLISYHNPANTAYEAKIAEYINQAHSGYHGGADDIITNIFLIVEQFNETPSYDPGRGKRSVPDYTYSQRTARAKGPRITVGKKLSREEKTELIRRLRIPV